MYFMRTKLWTFTKYCSVQQIYGLKIFGLFKQNSGPSKIMDALFERSREAVLPYLHTYVA